MILIAVKDTIYSRSTPLYQVTINNREDMASFWYHIFAEFMLYHFLPSSKDIASAITKAANSPTLNPAAATHFFTSYVYG